MLACDYSFARPSPAALKAAGYDGVYRYLAPLPNDKVLTGAELAALHGAALGVGLVWEGIGTAALYGQPQGAADALEANRQADLLGFPATVPIFYAVDFQPQPAQMASVAAYYTGCTSGRRWARLYGPKAVLDTLQVGGWQSAGWNAPGGISVYASVVQRLSPTVWPDDGTLDEDAVVGTDHGLWMPNTPRPPTPHPVPLPTEADLPNLILILDTSSQAFLYNTAAHRVTNLDGLGGFVGWLEQQKVTTYSGADADTLLKRLPAADPAQP